MADSRNKLQEAIAAQKGRKREEAPPPRPQRKAPPSPPPPSRTVAKAKPAKQQKPQKKAKPKKKPSGPKVPGAFSKAFSSFVEELKDAGHEISPKALLGTVSEGFQTLRSFVSSSEDELPPRAARPTQEPDEAEPESRSKTGAPAQTGAPGSGPATAAAGGAPADSTARPAAPAPAAQAGGSLDEAAAPTSPTGNAQPGADPGAPPQFSVTKVQKVQPRRPKKKIQPEEESASIVIDEDTPRPAEAAQGPAEPESETPSARKQERSREEEPEARAVHEEPKAPEPIPQEADRRQDEPVSREPSQQTTSAGEEPTKRAARVRESQEQTPAADEEEAPKGEAVGPAGKDKESKETKEPEPRKKPSPQAVQRLSKTEQVLRGFRSLQIVLEIPAWRTVIENPEARHTPLYAPRDRFDQNFTDTAFREGLKAASRLCQSFTIDPEHMQIDPEAIQRVREFQLDPNGSIKRDSDLLEKVLPADKVEETMAFVKEQPIRQLLYSVGTRLGTFVPTIEILARIYLALRKKNDIIPGERLKIQEEVLVRYEKAPYTDAMGKKARNLALNYFMDYLTEYGMKLYRTRFESVPDGSNNPEAHIRRHSAIQSNCCNVIEEWGTREGLSSHALFSVKARFMETCDLFLKEQVGADPAPTEETAN